VCLQSVCLEAVCFGGCTSKEPTGLHPSREEGVKVDGQVGAELEEVDGTSWRWTGGGFTADQADAEVIVWTKKRWLLLVPAMSRLSVCRRQRRTKWPVMRKSPF
jgi:hypothetical protein